MKSIFCEHVICEGAYSWRGLSVEINGSVENIGARRLHTVLERIGELAKDVDLNNFIL